MNVLGIYFGPKVISIVETKGGKVINNIQIPQSTISTGELEEKTPAELKVTETIALFKNELRRNKIDAKEAVLCLSGKDLIIRTFEIPILPHEELQSAINFEAKKYIPFKVEDLISDFQLKFDKITRTNLVLFMGIKKETLDAYLSVLSQLDIKISAIEYSAFSILRCLKLTGGVVGVIGVDLHGKDEVNFIIIENGFPLFSRDIVLTDGPAGLIKTEEIGPSPDLEKLKTEIRASLNYYHRKFPTKNIKRVFLLSGQDVRSDLEAFITEAGLSVQYVDVTRLTDESLAYSLSFIKGYSSSLFKKVKTNLKLSLLTAKEKAEFLKERAARKETLTLFKGVKLNYRIVTLSLFICIAVFGFGLYRTQSLRKELKSIVNMRTGVAAVNPEATYAELASADSEYKKKLNTLDNLIKKQLYLAEPLNIIPKAIPKALWLTKFYFSKREEGKAVLTLEGMVYLADSDKEFGAVNKFISNLKENPDFNKYFTDISISSLDRKSIDNELTATNFLISCKTYQESQ